MLYRLIIYITAGIYCLEGGGMVKKRKFIEEEEGSDDINFYSKNVRESLLDDDELSPMEEAFMNGYEDAV